MVRGSSRRGGGENFSPAVARIKRLIVKATCARKPGRRRRGMAARVEARRGAGAAGAIGAHRSAGGEKVAGVKVAINFSSRD